MKFPYVSQLLQTKVPLSIADYEVTSHSCTPLRNPTLQFVPLGVEMKRPSLLTCASTCSLTHLCYSFVFNQLDTCCKLGFWPTLSPLALDHHDTYTTPDVWCDTAAGFVLQQSGEVRVCVRMSPDFLDFATARTTCEGFAGNLYTVKTQEKLSILTSIGAALNFNFWVGLDDIESEGDFRWVDDGANITEAWRRTIFNREQPDNRGGAENCVSYNTYYVPLNDDFCLVQMRFLCEMLV
ncbi:uncharacterized protein LOC131937095 [Physella acuta]|uniref:uncharacterized protein LOC131937095 n=1 Tax=Physella acuta TaxID=109671 RepID=UPI0027DCB795|nr:uncharacterized protein LOC131937095 [Physella acuta]